MTAADDVAFERQSRRSLAIRILAVLAVIGLPLGGYLGFRIAQASMPPSSLAVFDRGFQTPDRSTTFRELNSFDESGLLITDTRLLTTIRGVKLFGGIGVQKAKDNSIVSVVCLAVEPNETTGSVTCVGREQFLRAGLHAGAAEAGRGDEAVTYRWGPTGDPTRE